MGRSQKSHLGEPLPAAQTCFRILMLSRSFSSFTQFKRNMYLVLNNKDAWVISYKSMSVRNMKEMGRAATMKAVKMTNTNGKMELKKRNEGIKEMRRAAPSLTFTVPTQPGKDEVERCTSEARRLWKNFITVKLPLPGDEFEPYTYQLVED